MLFNEFKDYVCDKITDRLGEGYEIRINPVTKNNGVVLTGMSVARIGATIAPTLYIEHFHKLYESGESLENIIESMIKVFLDNIPGFDMDIQDISNFEAVKDRLFCKVVNYERNKGITENSPYIKSMDLCILFYCGIGTTDHGYGSVLVKNDMFNDWNISVDELYETALENTKREYEFRIKDIREIIREMLWNKCKSGDEELFKNILDKMNTEAAPMYIVSNKQGVYGATSLLYTEEISRFAQKLKTNLYILPSSIHELIIIPEYDDIDTNFLHDMVKEVNDTEVSEAEILSENVYRFVREDNRLYNVYSA